MLFWLASTYASPRDKDAPPRPKVFLPQDGDWPAAMHCSSVPASGTVAFYSHGQRFTSFDFYTSDNKSLYRGGEAYWSACVDYVLRYALNFSTHFYSLTGRDVSKAPGFRQGEVLDAAYHRAVMDGKPCRWLSSMAHVLLNDHDWREAICRVRIMDWWSSRMPRHGECDDGIHGILPRGYSWQNSATLTPYRTSFPSIPIFPLSLLTLPASTVAARGRVGFVYAKECSVLHTMGVEDAIGALLDAQFELHTLAAPTPDCKFAHFSRFVQRGQHGHISPTQYAALFRDMAFVVGTGAPFLSPTPLEALAQGAAFLNPLVNGSLESEDGHYQHQHLAKTTGPPYSYKYDRRAPKTLVAAAEAAVRNRFASHVPFSNRPEATAAAACAMLADELGSMCRPYNDTAKSPRHHHRSNVDRT